MSERIMICEDAYYNTVSLKGMIQEEEKEAEVISISEHKKILPSMKLAEERNEKAKIVFINIKMQNKETFSVIKKMKNKHPGVKVVITGGIDLTDEILKKFIDINVKDFLVKPYKEEEVKLILESLK